ncbi:hypothetical protein [Luteibacter aegosomatissinici]|uniref:hypothetical protein n=1 Tax=Luteibacter aegosomatissinici TaxID=2911539 RepID=UPI001FFB3DC9|nr:hypothetical protein [Luteibacter aegosomatissinici]UPG92853.1 hypothetical protein L2Y97_13360 [Luteibacter aegosomatissinici]
MTLPHQTSPDSSGQTGDVAANSSFGVCAFVDLLGFAEEVRNVSSFDDLKRSRDRIHRVRERFDFNPDDETVLEVQEMYQKRVLAFSDSVIAYFPLRSRAIEIQGDFDPVFSELVGFAEAQGAGVVFNGDFIRGGVELGWWFEEGATLISDALVEAHGLETRADVPVLAIGERLYKHARSHRDRGFYATDIDPVATSFRLYEGTYKRGPTRFYYLDYIRICLESIHALETLAELELYKATPSGKARQALLDEGYRAKLLDWLTRHGQRIKDAHAAAPGPAKSKYVWLAGYHNEMCDLHLANPSCYCRL